MFVLIKPKKGVKGLYELIQGPGDLWPSFKALLLSEVSQHVSYSSHRAENNELSEVSRM